MGRVELSVERIVFVHRHSGEVKDLDRIPPAVILERPKGVIESIFQRFF